MRSAVILTALCATASAQVPGPAVPADVAREFQAGADAYRLGKFDEARAHLEKARTLDPKLPGPHRFLAAVAQAQARWQECIDSARIAIALNPHSVEIAETKKLHDDCRASAGRAPYRGDLTDSAAIAVTTNIPGASVKIGGLGYGGTPLAPRPIPPGALELEISKAGWKTAKLTVDAPAGIVTDILVELEPDPTAQDGGPDVAAPALPTTGRLALKGAYALRIDGKDATLDESGRVELAPGEHEVEVRAPDRDPWRRRVRIAKGQVSTIEPVLVDTSARESKERVGLALVGGAGAVGAFGFAAMLVSSHAAADAREILRVERARMPGAISTAEPLHTRADYEAKRDRARTWGYVSDAAYGAAAIAFGVGAYYLYRGAREHDEGPPPFAVVPTRGGAFVAKELAW